MNLALLLFCLAISGDNTAIASFACDTCFTAGKDRLQASRSQDLQANPGFKQFNHWIGGKEAGSLEVTVSETRTTSKNKLKIKRRGSSVEQNLIQTISRNEIGEISVSWTLSLASGVHRGQAHWSHSEPNALRVSTPNGTDSLITIGSDVLLWPPDVDEKMRLAAQDQLPLRISTFSFPSSSVSHLDLTPEGPSPTDAFPDSVLYRGTLKEGGSVSQITSWISPSAGQIKQISSNSGLIVITQRKELKPPGEFSGPAFFEWTLRELPQIPFLAWRDEIRVSGLPDLVETSQQKKIGRIEYLLTRAAPPGLDEARQLPNLNPNEIDTEEAPFLADSPLLGLNDAAINGLIARLKAKPDAARWELARHVNSFVFDLIRNKELDVGFASAPEVAKNPRGDCTEHVVLMIALLRRLGVPARAAFGWAGIDAGHESNFGLHAWVEVKIGSGWIPMDPTFDQSPAGAFRVTTSTSDLNSIDELGWNISLPLEIAPSVKVAPFRLQGNQLVVDDVNIKILNGTWNLSNDKVWLEHPALGRISVNGSVRTLPRPDSRFIHVSGRSPARYTKSLLQLVVDCGKNRWLYFEGLSENSALTILREIEIF